MQYSYVCPKEIVRNATLQGCYKVGDLNSTPQGPPSGRFQDFLNFS